MSIKISKPANAGSVNSKGHSVYGCVRNENAISHHGKSFAKRSWKEIELEHKLYLQNKGK